MLYHLIMFTASAFTDDMCPTEFKYTHYISAIELLTCVCLLYCIIIIWMTSAFPDFHHYNWYTASKMAGSGYICVLHSYMMIKLYRQQTIIMTEWNFYIVTAPLKMIVYPTYKPQIRVALWQIIHRWIIWIQQRIA